MEWVYVINIIDENFKWEVNMYIFCKKYYFEILNDVFNKIGIENLFYNILF